MKDQKGFGLIESLLIILIIAVIGFGGYYVWHSQHKTKPAASDSATTSNNVSPTKSNQTTDPYSGWSTYTLKQEKLSFKYPSSFTIKDLSDSNGDMVTLYGTNNFELTIVPGPADFGFPLGGCTVEKDDPVAFVGQAYHLLFCESDANHTGDIFDVHLSKTTSPGDFPPNRNETNSDSLKIYMDFGANQDATVTKQVSYITNDQNYKEAKLVIESMSY